MLGKRCKRPSRGWDRCCECFIRTMEVWRGMGALIPDLFIHVKVMQYRVSCLSRSIKPSFQPRSPLLFPRTLAACSSSWFPATAAVAWHPPSPPGKPKWAAAMSCWSRPTAACAAVGRATRCGCMPCTARCRWCRWSPADVVGNSILMMVGCYTFGSLRMKDGWTTVDLRKAEYPARVPVDKAARPWSTEGAFPRTTNSQDCFRKDQETSNLEVNLQSSTACHLTPNVISTDYLPTIAKELNVAEINVLLGTSPAPNFVSPA